ncbi:hypothetical protein [Flavobacterium coralii]|uniref:LIC_10190 family membrane protein n=1 Tax=Flavobacterium coralii TaxID=2838017 RepID=UPI000C355F71|nr:hypothetical protein [Flavobacterium sp.]|tara:strand:+ start:13194 stop:14834 length:1641 start_codon:yes stop_codon:yes gene_type:complete
MLLILAYWLFLLLITLPYGVLLQKICGIKSANICLTIVFGLFFLCFGFTVVSLFTALNFYALAIVILIAISLYYIYREDIKVIIKNCTLTVNTLKPFQKYLLLFFMFAAALKSAQVPFVIDNESYYIQTIKWANEYGLVKGLANLHIFLTQASPWHILHAGLNLNFTGLPFNDINGFIFLVTVTYAITQQEALKSWLSFLPLFSVFYFLFLDAPSPDLPLLCLLPVMFWLYTQNKEDNYKAAVLLFAFAAFIKVTVAPFALLFLPQLIRKKQFVFFSVVGMSVFVLWTIKNIIVSGYPLYPLTMLSVDADWKVPAEILTAINTTADKNVYGTAAGAGIGEKLTSWFTLPGIKGLLHKATVLLLVIMPFFKTIRLHPTYRLAYSAILAQFAILLLISPQFRFFLPVVVFLLLIIAHQLYKAIKKPLFYKIAVSAGALAAVILITNINYGGVTNNRFHQASAGFRFSQLYIPEPVTRYPDIGYNKLKSGNMEYYSPSQNFFLYGTANGPLPCVNSAQLRYFDRKTGYIPQLRDDNAIESGFKSVKTLR